MKSNENNGSFYPKKEEQEKQEDIESNEFLESHESLRRTTNRASETSPLQTSPESTETKTVSNLPAFCNEDELRFALSSLAPKGGIFEIKAFNIASPANNKPHLEHGLFNSIEAVIEAVRKLWIPHNSNKPVRVIFCPNPLNTERLGKATNQLHWSKNPNNTALPKTSPLSPTNNLRRSQGLEPRKQPHTPLQHQRNEQTQPRENSNPTPWKKKFSLTSQGREERSKNQVVSPYSIYFRKVSVHTMCKFTH